MSNNENVKVGEKAEDFTLKNQYEEEVSPSDFEGKKYYYHSIHWPGQKYVEIKWNH